MSSIFRMLSHARMFRTRAAALIALVGMITASTGLVVLSSSSASATSEVGLCHATGSDTSPYTFQAVAKSSTTYQGHYDHYLHPQETWHDGTWWNGVWHPAGTPKGDLIDGITGNVDKRLCDQKGTGAITVTPAVTFTDPTCAGTLAGWSGADGDKIAYAVTSGQVAAGKSVTVGATPKAGYVFGKRTQTSFSHTYPTPDCRTAVAPVAPEIHGAQCVDGQPGQTTTPSFTAPADTSSIHYSVAGDTITATLVDPTKNIWASNLNGWTKQSSTTATYHVTYPAAPDCSAELTLPGSLPVNPPSCTSDGSFTLPTSPAHVTWTSTGTPVNGVYGPGTYTVTAHADSGYYFVVNGQQVTTRDYSVKVDGTSSAAHCLALPLNNTPTGATCDAGGTYTLPTDGGHVTWSIKGPAATGDHLYGPGSYDVTATADNGYHFSDGTSVKTWKVEVPARLSGAQCTTEIPVPSAPVPTAATCATDGSLTLPAVDHVVWAVNNNAPAAGPINLGAGAYHVVARTLTGYAFPGGTTHDYGTIKVDAKSGDCPVHATAVEPTVTVSTHCGVEGSYTIPATAGVQYLLDGSPVAAGTHSGPVTGKVTAVGLGSTVLTNPDFSFALVLPPAVQCPPGTTEVTPAAPTFVDPTCAHPDGARAVYADTEAVDYSQTGTVGLGGTVTVTAVPRTGFTFPAGFVASWTHTFPKGVVCATETSKPKPSHTPTVKPTQATGHHHPSSKPTVLGTEAVAVPTAVDAGLATWQGDTSSPTGSLLGESLVAAGLVLLLAGAALGLGRRRRGEHQV